MKIDLPLSEIKTFLMLRGWIFGSGGPACHYRQYCSFYEGVRVLEQKIQESFVDLWTPKEAYKYELGVFKREVRWSILY